MIRNKNLLKLIRKKYKTIQSFGHSGSSAGTILVKDKISGNKYVLKFATWNGIGSSGLPSLKAQSVRLKELSEIKNGEFKNLFPSIIESVSFKNNFFYVMEYFPSSNPVSTYYYRLKSQYTTSFMRNVNKIIKLLSLLYEIELLPAPPDYIQAAHINRMVNRTNLLTKNYGDTFDLAIKEHPVKFTNYKYGNLTDLFKDLQIYDDLYVNGEKYMNFRKLKQTISSRGVLEIVAPKFIPKYYHGDSTLRNYLINKNGDIKLIDIRGTNLPNGVVSKIDIAYELAKILRTFYLEIIRNNDFTIEMSKSSKDVYFEFIFGNKKQVNNFIKLRTLFLNSIKNYQKENEVLDQEDNLKLKILYAEAAHFIADAINRIESDKTGKQTLAYYLLGLQLYKEFLKECQFI